MMALKRVARLINCSMLAPLIRKQPVRSRKCMYTRRNDMKYGTKTPNQQILSVAK